MRTHSLLTAKEQAAELGRTYSSVVARRIVLRRRGALSGLGKYRQERRRPWTEEEQGYVRSHLGIEPLEAIATHLRRTVHAITVRCKKAGISRRERRRANSSDLTATQVARIMGVDIHDVTRLWIGWGILRGVRHRWLRAGGGAQQWAIRREDLVEFLIDHPWQYDRTRIGDPFFRRVADQAWSRDPLYSTRQAARLLGFHGSHEGQHGLSSFLRVSAPKLLSPSQLVVRRRGNPHASGRSLAGMETYIPRSTIEAIRRSGWRNISDQWRRSDAWTASRAARELHALADRPRWVTRSGLADRIRFLMARGAIATWEETLLERRCRFAKPADVMALRAALFARPITHIWPNIKQRRLIGRHDASWLERPRELVLAMADGRMRSLMDVWMRAEFSPQWLRRPEVRRWARVTRHLAEVLRQIGPRTKYRSSRVGIYHTSRHGRQLVLIPLSEARRRGLRECGFCAHQRDHSVRRRAARLRRAA